MLTSDERRQSKMQNIGQAGKRSTIIVGKKESIVQRNRQRNSNIGTKTGRDDMISIFGKFAPPGVTVNKHQLVLRVDSIKSRF